MATIPAKLNLNQFQTPEEKTIHSLKTLIQLLERKLKSQGLGREDEELGTKLKLKIKESFAQLKEYELSLSQTPSSPTPARGEGPWKFQRLKSIENPVSPTSSSATNRGDQSPQPQPQPQELESVSPACSPAIKDRIKLLNSAASHKEIVQRKISATKVETIATWLKPSRQISTETTTPAAAAADPDPDPVNIKAETVTKTTMKQLENSSSQQLEEFKHPPKYVHNGKSTAGAANLDIFAGIPPSKFQTITEIELSRFEIEPQVLLDSLKHCGALVQSIKLSSIILVGIFTEKIQLPCIQNFEVSLCFKEYVSITKELLKSLIFWDTAANATVEFDSLTRLGVNIDIVIRDRRVLKIRQGAAAVDGAEAEQGTEFVKNYSMIGGGDDDIIHPPTSAEAIAAQSHLKSLALRNCTIEIPLHTIPKNLTHLNLYKMEVQGGGLDDILKEMKSLRDLRLTPLIDRFQLNMSSLPTESLTHLCVYNVELMYDSASRVAQSFKNLKTLCFDFCSMNEEIVNNFGAIFPVVSRICLFDPTNNNSNYLLLLEILRMKSVEWIWFDKYKDLTFRESEYMKSINGILGRSGSLLRSEDIVEFCDHWSYFNLERSGGEEAWKFVKRCGPAQIRFDMFGMPTFWTSFEAFQKETVRVLGAVVCCEGTLTV